jgi:hypothetical protein
MTVCTTPRHAEHNEPPETEPHSFLCRPCRAGLSADLRRLPALHADLENIPATSGGDGTGLPFSEPAADCRLQIRHDLRWWFHEIREERGMDSPPAYEYDALTGDEQAVMTFMCGWLHAQVTWCSFRDWAPDMAGAIGADRARAVALLDPWVTKRFEIPGPDGACLDCDQGRMWVTVYVYAADHRKSFIGCTECGARWEFGGAWLPFVRQVIRRRNLAAAG